MEFEHYFSKLERSIRLRWNDPALCNFQGEEFTFGELATNIAKFHILFGSLGIKKGDKIALSARNSARWGVSFLSISTYNAVVVPILNDFLPENIANLTDHSDSKLLFTDPDIFEKMDPEMMPKIKAVISVKDFTLLYSRTDEIKAAFEKLPEAFNSRYPLGFSAANVQYDKNNLKDLAVINYTSGTTSAPKGVMLRYESLCASIQFGGDGMPTGLPGDAVVSMLPMGHIYGLVFEFLYPVCNGDPIYFLGKTPSPTLLLNALKTVRPYIILTVPLVMEKIYKSSIQPAISRWYMKILLFLPGINCLIYKKIRKKLLAAFGGRVRNIIMGGAALNPDVEKTFKKMKMPYTVGYGMTEAAPLLAYEHWSKYVPGSCGKPMTFSEVRIDSEDPAHIAGEILARGVNICSGYYKNEEANKAAFSEDGYLHTGDLGIIDDKGNLFIKGRCKTMILSASGQNIYPEELEAVINSQPYIAESVVVDRASKLVALIYLDRDAIRKARLDDEAISDIPEAAKKNANRLLPSYSQISKIEVVTEPFEKTPKMSIKRFLYK